MRRVPEFLPFDIRVPCQSSNGMLPSALSSIQVSTRMEFVLYKSPALIQGLLMTEVLSEENQEVQRYFFGYRCSTCETTFLVPQQVRREEELYQFLRHKCDPSEIRRAVRNARRFGCSDDEDVMENVRGGWSYRKRSEEH